MMMMMMMMMMMQLFLFPRLLAVRLLLHDNRVMEALRTPELMQCHHPSHNKQCGYDVPASCMVYDNKGR